MLESNEITAWTVKEKDIKIKISNLKTKYPKRNVQGEKFIHKYLTKQAIKYKTIVEKQI
jgi:hypothetical protein